MKLFKKKSLHHKPKHTEKIAVEINPSNSICDINYDEYIGKTITVYVNAGGIVGNGFTGILMKYTDTYISIIVLPSTPPLCSLGNACNAKIDNILLCLSCPFNGNATVGTIAEISIMSIVALVHNNWGHRMH